MAKTARPQRDIPDPDQLRRDDPVYWVAALVLAVEKRNRQREKTTQQGLRRALRRLGYDLRPVRPEAGR